MKFTAVLFAALFAVADAAIPRAVVSVPATQSVVSNGSVQLTVLFSEPVTGFILGASFLSDLTGVPAAPATCSACTVTGIPSASFTQTVPNRAYTISLTGLSARGSYTFSAPAGCNARSLTTNECQNVASVATVISKVGTPGVVLSPGGLNTQDNRFNQIVPNGGTYQYTTGPDFVQMIVQHSERQYNFNNVRTAITATSNGVVAPIRDIVMQANNILFTVQGVNDQTLTIKAQAGLITDVAGVASPASAAVNIALKFPEACKRMPATASTWGACSCVAGTTAGTQTRVITAGASIGPYNGGAACPAVAATTATQQCACATLNQASCAGRCQEVPLPGSASCSCGPACNLHLGGCCADTFKTCRPNLPECGVDTACGTEIAAGPYPFNTGNVCSCDAFWGFVTPCKNFQANCVAKSAFCRIITGATAVPATAPAWCASGVNPKVGSAGSLAGNGCSCAPGCAAAGNCCVDYSQFCKAPNTKCGVRANCGSLVGDSINDRTNACFCDVDAAFYASYGTTACTDSVGVCTLTANEKLCVPQGLASRCGERAFIGANKLPCDCRPACTGVQGGIYCCSDLKANAALCP